RGRKLKMPTESTEPRERPGTAWWVSPGPREAGMWGAGSPSDSPMNVIKALISLEARATGNFISLFPINSRLGNPRNNENHPQTKQSRHDRLRGNDDIIVRFGRM